MRNSGGTNAATSKSKSRTKHHQRQENKNPREKRTRNIETTTSIDSSEQSCCERHIVVMQADVWRPTRFVCLATQIERVQSNRPLQHIINAFCSANVARKLVFCNLFLEIEHYRMSPTRFHMNTYIRALRSVSLNRTLQNIAHALYLHVDFHVSCSE